MRSDCRTPEEKHLRARHAEIKQGLRSPVPIALSATCIGCGDTHKVRNDPDERTDKHRETAAKEGKAPWAEFIPCPICPSPCRSCGSDAGYCRKTPCSCPCHRGGKAKARRSVATITKPAKPAPTLEAQPKAVAKVIDRLTLWREVIATSRSYAWRWGPIDMEIGSVLVHQDGSAEIEMTCPSLTARALDDYREPKTYTLAVPGGPMPKLDLGKLPQALQSAVFDVTEHAKLAATGKLDLGKVAKRIADDGDRLGVTDPIGEWRRGMTGQAAK